MSKKNPFEGHPFSDYLNSKWVEGFLQGARGGFCLQPGDIAVQHGGTEHHPKWKKGVSGEYLGTYRANTPMVYLGLKPQTLDSNAPTVGWAHTFLVLDGTNTEIFMLQYPSYLRDKTFTVLAKGHDLASNLAETQKVQKKVDKQKKRAEKKLSTAQKKERKKELKMSKKEFKKRLKQMAQNWDPKIQVFN